MSYSPEATSRPGPSPERAAAQDTSSSSSGSSSSGSSGSGSFDEEEEEGTTSGRQGSPTEGVRETPTRVVGDHPSPAPEPTEEDTAGPAAPAVAEFEFLNSENVEQQMSQLTKGEAARIAERLMGRISRAAQLLQGRAMLAEEADHHKKTAAHRLKEIKDLQAELEKTQKVASRAIGEAKELKAQLENPSELARAAFKDRELGSAFLTAARGTEIGEELIVSFGRWGFTAGKRKMLERVRSRLEQALDGEDLQLVLSALPPDLADPGPSPFAPKAKASEAGASTAATPSGKEPAAGAREMKK
ncbi:PREDICTED: leucine zipper putative tumor suppressor 2-like [Ipomoea nil]|uniref:leucine zipper putative tumor suppressor 2-like n=1 Tax=Ipomoea nil TaxID=35883 RepID=UPI0009013C32|nr:PREDICTED: leucine zipper putative tumor suppressor 2-like [Ipomoea nil]